MKWFELFWMMMCVILIVVVFGDFIGVLLTGIVNFVVEIPIAMCVLFRTLPDVTRIILAIITMVLIGVWMYFYIKNHLEK